MPHSAARPRFLNLLHLRMPVGAVASIAHRISGIVLFLCIPLAVFLLELSLRGPEGFERAARLLDSAPMRVLLTLLAWSLAHHLLAGVRFLLIDLEIGVTKPMARASAFAVNLAAPMLALLLLWRWW